MIGNSLRASACSSRTTFINKVCFITKFTFNEFLRRVNLSIIRISWRGRYIMYTSAGSGKHTFWAVRATNITHTVAILVEDLDWWCLHFISDLWPWNLTRVITDYASIGRHRWSRSTSAENLPGRCLSCLVAIQIVCLDSGVICPSCIWFIVRLQTLLHLVVLCLVKL